MTGYDTMWAALVGGAAGGIAWLVSSILRKRAPNSFVTSKNGNVVSILVVFFLVTTLVQQTSLKQWVRDIIFPPTRLEKQSRELVPAMMNDPDVIRAFSGKSKAEARALGQTLAARGLKRLPFEDLVTWNDIRTTLASSSPELCAALWKGGLQADKLQQALESLPSADLARWMNMSSRAMTLEAKDAPYDNPTEEDRALLFKTVESELNQAERQRFMTSSSKGAALPDEEACWVLTTLQTKAGGNSVDRHTKERILRVLAAMGSPK